MYHRVGARSKGFSMKALPRGRNLGLARTHSTCGVGECRLLIHDFVGLSLHAPGAPIRVLSPPLGAGLCSFLPTLTHYLVSKPCEEMTGLGTLLEACPEDARA